MYAEDDRRFERRQMHEDFGHNSPSTAEDDPVMMIHQKSKKLREKHLKY
jgi:hypothetical protein